MTRYNLVKTCECGAEFRTENYRPAKHCKSCRFKKPRNLKHGGSYTRLYHRWAWVKQYARTFDIPIVWRTFADFKDWSLANGYADDKKLQRKSRSEGYTEENCKWIPMRTK